MTIVIKRRHELAFGLTVQVGAHALIADLSATEGGNDAGPGPHDFYDTALGTCKALTILWYAKRKGIPVEDLEVAVERNAAMERSGSYSLATRIIVGGPVSDAQLQELKSVAEKCPIHKLMTEVTTTITTAVERLR